MLTKSSTSIIIAFLLSATIIPITNAQQLQSCEKNGQQYEHGTIVGDFFCNDGKWERTY